MTIVRLIARPMLSTMFLTGGWNSLRNADRVAVRARPVTEKLTPVVQRATGSLPIPVNAKTMVQANALLHIVGGAMLATGRAPRLSSLALAASLVPTTFARHRYWEEADPQVRANERTHFLKNVSMMGGLLLAGVDTEGRPSLAWRAKRQASNARKRASRLTPG